MWTAPVVSPAPLLDNLLRLIQRSKPVQIQAFLAQSPVETNIVWDIKGYIKKASAVVKWPVIPCGVTLRTLCLTQVVKK